MKRALVFLIVGFGLAACKTEPTKINVTQQREYVQIREKAEKPLDVQEQTTVLDTRSNFVYGLNHVRNSLYFPWTDLAEDARKGEVLRDAHQAALRLALLGLSPTTPVLIVGDGTHGAGEEGRLAWTLLYFGYQDVQTASTEALRGSMTQDPSPPAKNVPIEAAETQTRLQIPEPEFLRLSKLDPKIRGEQHTVIIDVRSAAEATKSAKDFAFANIEWKLFYTTTGRPDWRVKKKLEAKGISPDWEIILISNRGVRSAAAAYALLALGYTHVQNFTAGFNSLQK